MSFSLQTGSQASYQQAVPATGQQQPYGAVSYGTNAQQAYGASAQVNPMLTRFELEVQRCCHKHTHHTGMTGPETFEMLRHGFLFHSALRTHQTLLGCLSIHLGICYYRCRIYWGSPLIQKPSWRK